MVAQEDRLITLPHSRYGEYLTYVYRRMVEWVPHDADVVEVGVRWEDRGILSPPIIPHATFRTMDRDPRRGQVVRDVLVEPVEGADVIISTCILHHTAEADVPKLLSNLRAPTLLLSGPNVDVLPRLFGDHKWHIFGDHKWHIDIALLKPWLEVLGYEVQSFPIGLSLPYCELLVVATR